MTYQTNPVAPSLFSIRDPFGDFAKVCEPL